MAIMDAETRIIGNRRYALTQGVKSPSPVRKDSRLAGTVHDLVYSEYKSEQLPDYGYRRGEGETDVIPGEWNGTTFASHFTLGGPDMEMMGAFIPLLKTGTRIVVPVDDKQPDVEAIFGHIRQVAASTEESKSENEYGRIDDMAMSRKFPSYLVASMLPVSKQQQDTFCVFFDLYTGGVISSSQYIPDMSSSFCAQKADKPILYGYGDMATKSAMRWTYTVYAHASPSSDSAKYPTLPKDGTVKKEYITLQKTLTRLLNVI